MISKTYPNIEKHYHVTKFGRIENELRGYNEEKLINPPIKLLDKYYWLRDDSRTNKKVLAAIEKENQYTDSIMKPYQTLKNQLYD